MAAAKKTAASRAATGQSEKINGLQPAPDGGTYFIRENAEPETDDNGNVTNGQWEMVLRIEGEEDYVTPLFNLDDGSITGSAWTLLAQRRARLRESAVGSGEVEVVPAT